MTEPEPSLVQRAQGGDRAAFDELVRRTTRLVFARLYVETGDPHRAEDLLQETMLTAYRTLGQLTEPDKFRSWLLRIAHNAAIDAVRHDSRQKRTPEPTLLKLRQDSLAQPGPHEQAERNDFRDHVLAILRELPEEYRTPITLRYLAGADYATIQTQMGLTNGSLRGLLHRGMQQMRAELKKLMGDDYPG